MEDRVPVAYLQDILKLVDTHKLTTLELPGIKIVKPFIITEPLKPSSGKANPLANNYEPDSIEALDAEIEAQLGKQS